VNHGIHSSAIRAGRQGEGITREAVDPPDLDQVLESRTVIQFSDDRDFASVSVSFFLNRGNP
jgi:hypothetical protein